MFNAIKETRSRSPALVDTVTMGRDVAKWKVMDPPVRDPFIISSSTQVFN
jgi:hypothetical protein